MKKSCHIKKTKIQKEGEKAHTFRNMYKRRISRCHQSPDVCLQGQGRRQNWSEIVKNGRTAV